MIGFALYTESKDVNDYDFAVLNIPPKSLLNFYGELLRTLSKNVDIIDLSSKKTGFKNIAMKERKIIYGGPAVLKSITCRQP